MIMAMVYFTPGDEVMVRQALPTKPIMVVREVKKVKIRAEEDKGQLLGILCYWFTEHGLIQEFLFNSKDLLHLKEQR